MSSLKKHFTEWPFKGENLIYKINVKVGDGVWPRSPNGATPDNKISYVEFYKGEIDYNIKIHKNKLPEAIHPNFPKGFATRLERKLQSIKFY